MKNVEKIKPSGIFTNYIYKAIPLAFDESMSYYETLCGILNLLKNQEIIVNNNADALIELQDYVTHYFDNLDVQEEINNKLDEMAESGELEEIIASYLNVNAILAYNTKDDMINAENLVNGSIARTLGNNNYLDGYGAFYKIRTIINTDIIDGVNKIALTNFNTLLAELIPDTNINNINNEINDIHATINNMYMKKNQKLSCCKNSYSPDFDLKGFQYGLSFERLGDNGSSFNHQGLCFNNVDGTIYGNDAGHIFKLETTKPTTKINLYDVDLGHGGDCCIYYNKMYIVDPENNNINIVNLDDGTKTTIEVNDSNIINNNTDGHPIIGGISVLENDIYIAVNDELDVHTNLATNSTIRIYKYNLNEQIFRKIFETENNICYIQGMTMDEENFYIGGNKPFTSSYIGNIMYIINKKELRLLDKIHNNYSSEFEGLDYCSINGIEGILTTINNYGSFSHLGVYAFYGNVTRQVIYINTATEYKCVCVSRGGIAHIHYEKTDTFTANETYRIDNFLNNTFLGYLRGTGGHNLAAKANGNARTDLCNVDYDFVNDQLILYPATTTSKVYVDLDIVL